MKRFVYFISKHSECSY